jgi:hypothetical protein
VLLATYYVAFMTHEYGHSFAARILGITPRPWPIHWGSNSIANILFLDELDEHVDYDDAMASGKNVAVAVVALSGIPNVAATHSRRPVGQLAAGREPWKRQVLTAGQNTANSRSSQLSRTRPSRARSAM